MIRLLSSFPTSIFTGMLAFCLTWWIVTTVASGIDADSDGGGHAGHAGHAGGHVGHSTGHATGHAGHGAHGAHGAHGHGHDAPGHGAHGHGPGHGADGHHFIGRAFATGFVPLPLALTILSFGAWAVSLILQYGFGNASTARLALGVGIVVLLVALVAGFMLLRALRRPIGKIFDTEYAPDRNQAVGSTCKVRTLVVTDRLGDAEVLTGPTKGSLIKVRADEGRFARGDLALIVDYDQQSEAFIIDDLDEMLHPG